MLVSYLIVVVTCVVAVLAFGPAESVCITSSKKAVSIGKFIVLKSVGRINIEPHSRVQ